MLVKIITPEIPLDEIVGKITLENLNELISIDDELNPYGCDMLITPVFMAAIHRRPDIMKVLINLGADVNLGRLTLNNVFSNFDAFYICSNYKPPTELEDKEICDCNTESSLEIVEIFIKAGLTREKLTDMIFFQGHLPIISVLMKHNINLDIYTYWPPLHTCCERGYLEIASLLISYGVDIDFRSESTNGYTPLIIACENRNCDIVKKLVFSGANVNLCVHRRYSDWVPMMTINTVLNSISSIFQKKCIMCSDGSAYIIGADQMKNKIVPIYLKMDKLISLATKVGNRLRYRLRKKIALIRLKIRNMMKEFHHKTSKFLLDNLDVIILPDYGSRKMVESHKLSHQINRRILTWSHCRFKQILIDKSENYQSGIIINETEEFTTQTCICGSLNEQGCNKMYLCKNCNYTAHRDIHGALMIGIKAISRI